MEGERSASRQPNEVYPGVVVDPRFAHGAPLLAGTCVPVRLVMGQLAGGESIEAVMRAYALTEGQVRAALAYAAELVAVETVYTM